jgi:hypothetical protein
VIKGTSRREAACSGRVTTKRVDEQGRVDPGLAQTIEPGRETVRLEDGLRLEDERAATSIVDALPAS